MGFLFMNIPPVADQFMSNFGVEYAGLSVFLSTLYWSHGVTQVPAGMVVDRIGPLRSLYLCLAVCCIASLVPFLAPKSLVLASSMRIVLGAGASVLFLVMVKVAKTLAPADRIARVQGAQGAAFCIGTMLPYMTLSWVGEWGWIMAYLIPAVFCVVYGVASLWLPREALRAAGPTVTWEKTGDALRNLAYSKPLWLLGICHGFAYGSLNSLGKWLPSILIDTRPESVLRDWAVVTSIMLVVGTVGRLLGGEVSRVISRRRLLCCVTLIVGLCYWMMAVSHTPLLVMTAAFVLALACGGAYAAVFTLSIDMAPAAYVATAVGFMSMIANGVNIVLILVFGNTRQYFGDFSNALFLAGGAALCVFLVGSKMGWLRRPSENG